MDFSSLLIDLLLHRYNEDPASFPEEIHDFEKMDYLDVI